MKYITVIGCKKCRRCDSICPAMAIEHIDGTARVKIIHEKCNFGKIVEGPQRGTFSLIGIASMLD